MFYIIQTDKTLNLVAIRAHLKLLLYFCGSIKQTNNPNLPTTKASDHARKYSKQSRGVAAVSLLNFENAIIDSQKAILAQSFSPQLESKGRLKINLITHSFQ